MALDIDEQLESLLTDPLQELWDLYEAVLPKPSLQGEVSSEYAGPNQGNFEHPVTKRNNEIDSLIAQGQDPVSAHKAIMGDIDLSNVQSKADFASTLGRIQDDKLKRAVKIEPEKGSILARDASIEKTQDQVTRDDLRTPMNQQVPDIEQQPVDQVAEDCYNDDVAYLRKYGRA